MPRAWTAQGRFASAAAATVVGSARMSIGWLVPSSSIVGHAARRSDHARNGLAVFAEHDEGVGLRSRALRIARRRGATPDERRQQHHDARPRHRQSPHVACTTAIPAAAAVSARSTRGPSRSA